MDRLVQKIAKKNKKERKGTSKSKSNLVSPLILGTVFALTADKRTKHYGVKLAEPCSRTPETYNP